MKKTSALMVTFILSLLAACSQVSVPTEDPLFGSDTDGAYEVVARSDQFAVGPQGLTTQATNTGDQLRFYVELRRYSGSRYKAVHVTKEGGQERLRGDIDVRLMNESSGQGNTSASRTFDYRNGQAPSTITVATSTKTVTRGYSGSLRLCARAEGEIGSYDASGSYPNREEESDDYQFRQEVCFITRL